MNVALLGFDVEGRASYEYFARQGHTITICDQNADLVVPEGVPSVVGDGYLDDLGKFDLLVRTAGLQPSKILAKNPDVGAKITTLINEFFKVCPTKNIIGITGTKGKGTTSTLIYKMLEAADNQVFLGGNIGVPPLEFLPKLTPESWVVLELSSFQLSDFNYAPHIGICLLVVPEHLDWHGKIEDYIASKSRLFAHQTATDIAIYYPESADSKAVVSASKAQKIPYCVEPGAFVSGDAISINGQEICKLTDIKLLGEHNVQNVCAAITAAWQVTQNIEATNKAISDFTGLPYRLEPRGQKNGIHFYNDSFASTPHAPLAAIKSIHETKIMIMGGYDRGLDLADLAAGVKAAEDSIAHVLLMGVTGPKLAEAFNNVGFGKYTVSDAKTMTEIVEQATKLAETGQAVVLSPGFASFDMFKNFEDRGQQFNAAVEAL